MPSIQEEFQAFMKRREEASQAYINGDVGPLDDQAVHQSPASIFGPKGDYVQGARAVNARNKADAQSFDAGGETHLEIMQMGAAGDLAYWAGIQRSTVRFKGKKEANPLDLRVTEVFRREDGQWKLMHRHADPLSPDAEKDKKE